MRNIVTTAIFIMATISAFALEFDQGDFHYKVIDYSSEVICSPGKNDYPGLTGDIKIPNEVTHEGKTYHIVSLTGFNETLITSIVIPNSVKRIEYGCFSTCIKLKEITFGENVEYIGSSALSSCRALERITFLSTFPPVFNNGSYSYEFSDVIINVTQPLTIVTDKENLLCYACALANSETISSFISVNKLVSTTSPTPLRICSDDDFEYLVNDETNECAIINCHSGSRTYFDGFNIPGEAVLKEGGETTTLKIVGVGSGKSGKPLMYVKGNLTMSDNIRFIGDYVFSGNYNSASNLEDVVMSENLRYIGQWSMCGGIKNITFNDKLEVIRPHAFQFIECDTLKLPAKLRKIGESVFYRGKYESVEFGDELEEIGVEAFAASERLRSVKCTSSITKIDDKAFYRCISLREIELNHGLKSIGESAFAETSAGFQQIFIPNTVIKIGDRAFDTASSIFSFVIEDGNAPISIGKNGIGANRIVNLYIGREYDMPDAKFASLRELEIGNTVKSIPNNAFKNSGELNCVKFGSGLTSIGAEAFMGCRLEEVTIPPKVRSIGESCFSGNRLRSITIGAGIERIGDYAFSGNSIEQINITSKIPPQADENIFSNYDACLFTDPTYSDAYSDTGNYWNRFRQNYLKVADDVIISATEISLDRGEEYTLSAEVSPSDVSLPTIYWESSNPAVAMVDSNGNVSMSAITDDETPNSCTIKAYTLYADSPVAECKINGGEMSISFPAEEHVTVFNPQEPYTVYNLAGQFVSTTIQSIANGFYIVQQGNNSYKIIKK